MMASFRSVAAIGALLLGGSGWGTPAAGQQFNSDNYLSKPAGVVTMIATLGQRNEIFMLTFSLLPRWEFTTAAYIVNEDDDPNTDDGYSTTLYAKYMLYENAAKTGGAAVKFGTGLDPGYLTEVGVEDAFRSFWTNLPITFPFLQNRLAVDFMPGLTFSREYGTEGDNAWGYTYSIRAAWYPESPKWAFVGEVFGAEGELTSIPEFKIGPRWEPDQYTTFALTYGQEFNGHNGARFEVGMMLFTPPFFCIRGCR